MINKPSIVIPAELRTAVIDFALISGLEYFRANNGGPLRRLCNLNNFPDLPLCQQVSNFAQQCYNQLAVPIVTEPRYGNFIGVGSVNSFVHPHVDRAPDGLNHVRLNFLLVKPDTGGMPIIDGVEYSLAEGECWINFASTKIHSSSAVGGTKERIVLSLGSLVPTEYIPVLESV